MNKEIVTIKRIIEKNGIGSLDTEETQKYIQFRISNLLGQRHILTRRELFYLLCETGPGNLRIDPLVLREMSLDFTLLSQEMTSSVDSKTKNLIDKEINEAAVSSTTFDAFSSILSKYFDDIKKVPIGDVFIFKAKYKTIKILIMVSNTGWVLPDSSLVAFIKRAREENSLPIIIARKIHGILFPAFKLIGILGVNTYKTFIPEESLDKINKLESSLVLANKYHEQIDNLDNYEKHFTDVQCSETTLRRFLDNTLPKVYQETFAVFSSADFSKIRNFKELIENLPKSKTKTAISDWYKLKEEYLVKDE
jgi:hypothetical protein